MQAWAGGPSTYFATAAPLTYMPPPTLHWLGTWEQVTPPQTGRIATE